MKILIAFIVFCLFFVKPAFSHPASKIDIAIDGKQMTVRAVHSVGNPEDHYIDSISVTLNGQKVINQIFNAQITDATQEIVYVIPSLKVGDKIVVETRCNKGGGLIKTLTVE